MKAQANTEPAAETSGDMETTRITISQDEGDMTMIMDVLTSTLYTDKIAAQLREYGCNGYDANVEAGNQAKPLKVRLPNRLDQSLSIRDYGFGMDKEQIAKVFCQLGRSTKRNSNEFTGMLGIGSKAGFAYGDLFMVISYVKGRKVVYNAYRDKGKPQMAQLQEEPTTEPDGIEIKIPVRLQDVPEFVSKAERVFRYFKVLPDITGATITWANRSHQFEGTGWRYTGNAEAVAIMGNVGYKIDGVAMGLPMDRYDGYSSNHTDEQKFAILLKSGVELDFNIGELEIAANREGLQYRDLTKKAITARLTAMLAEVADVFSKKVVGAKNLWEAKCVYASVFERRSSYGSPLSIEQLVAKDIMWNGNKVNGSAFDLTNKDNLVGVTVTQFRLSSRSHYAVPANYTFNYMTYSAPASIAASPHAVLVLNDMPNQTQSPTRLKGWFEKNPKCEDIVVFTFKDDTVKKKYLKARELHESQLIKYSGLPVWVPPPNVVTPSAHRAKHSAKVFVLDEASPNTSAYDVRSTFWKTETVDMQTGGGMYVILDSFNVRQPDFKTSYAADHPHAFLSKVKMLRNAKLIDGPIYGIKIGVILGTSSYPAVVLGPKWVLLEKEIENNYDKLVKAASVGQELADSNAALSFASKRTIDEKWADEFPAKSLMHKFLKNVVKMNAASTLSVDLRKILNSRACDPWVKTPKNLPSPSIDLAKEQQNVYTKYPLLGNINGHALMSMSKVAIKNVADYVSLIESV